MPEFKKPKKNKRYAPPPISPEKKAVGHSSTKPLPNKPPQKKSQPAQTIKKPVKANNSHKPQNKGRQKKKNNKHKNSYVIYYAFIIIVILIVVSILSVTVLFNVDNFVVEGESKYSDEEIIDATEVKLGANLIRMDSKLLEKRIIEKLLWIDKVEISKSLPRSLIISIEESVPLANIQIEENQSNYYIISQSGRVLEKTNVFGNCIVVKGYEPAECEVGQYLETKNTRKSDLLYELIGLIEEIGLSRILEIDMTDHLDIILNYDGRVNIVLGSGASLQNKIRSANEMLKTEIAENESGTLRVTNLQKITFLPSLGNEDFIDDDIVPDTVPETELPEID